VGYLIGDKMALLHPPKCAGLWTRSACAAVGLPWARFEGCQHSDQAAPDDRWSMVFVRHPVTWLKSFWMFHERTGWDQFTDSPGFIFYACHRTGEPFSAFVARYLEKMPGAIGRMFARYELNAHDIGKVETIVDDLKFFIATIHPEIDTSPIDEMDRLNASSAAQKLSTNFANGQVDAVKRAEVEFMERYDYQ
jgi:hypothetical protein